MSPTNPPAFEHLPVEIHAEMLRQMASPEDVYSMVRASPKALGSFLLFREDILIRVIQAYLPPDIFAEYLGLLHVPKYEDWHHVPNESELSYDTSEGKYGEDESGKYLAWSDLVDSFFETHFKNIGAARSKGIQKYVRPKNSEKADVNFVMSTYGMLKRFIKHYQFYVRKKMANTRYVRLDFDPPLREAQLSQDWPPLSGSETFRLHRGFLRYELCCRLNTMTKRSAAELQFKSFGNVPYPPLSEYIYRFEEEEIQCIWAYVANQYQALIQDVAEDFCCDVWRLSRKARHAPDSQVTLVPDIIPGDDFQNWEYNMSCLGLPLLQQVLHSGIDNQRRFLKNTNLRRLPPYHGFLFLDVRTDMDCEWHHRANHIYKSISLAWSFSEPMDEVDSEDNRLLWLRYESENDIAFGLQDVGWVFWEDHTRLKYFGSLGRAVEGHHISQYLATLYDRGSIVRTGLRRMGTRSRYPEEIMYVTQEGHQELLDQYAAKPVEPDGEYFLLDRLRAISEWPSKEVSPAFQEVCSGRAAMDSFLD